MIRLRKTRSSHSALVNVCGGRLNKDRQRASLFLAVALILAGCGSSSTTTTTTGTLIPSLQPYPTPTGTVSTFSATGSIDSNGIFFQKLGTNARACDSCHQLNQGMSISAASTQALFTSTSGTDPLFLAVDGANCPTAATGDSAGHSYRRGAARERAVPDCRQPGSIRVRGHCQFLNRTADVLCLPAPAACLRPYISQ